MRHWYAVKKFFNKRAIPIVTHLKTPSRPRQLYFSPRPCYRKSLVPTRQALVMSFYAVRKGKTPGIYHTWEECKSQTSGFSKPEFRKFPTAAGAEAYMRGDQSKTPIETAMKSPQASSRGQKRNFASVTDESQWQVVYTDGACKGNGKTGSTAGVGVFWGPNDPRNLAERCPGDQTNNRAELIAIIRALETAPMTKEKLLIKTDSQYSINCIEQWLPNWMNNKFQTSLGEPVKNAGVIRYLSSLLAERGKRGQRVHLQFTKGHSGDPGNDGADAQANVGAILPPCPELDWEAIQSKASELIESLDPISDIPTALVVDIRPRLSESPERPTKMPKSHTFASLASTNSPPITAVNQMPTPVTAFPNQVPSHIPIATVGLTPTRPARSPLRLNKTWGRSPDRLTVYSKAIRQAASTPEPPAVLMMQPLSPALPQPRTPPVAKSRQVTSPPMSTTPHPQSNYARTNEASKSTFPPKSPLTVSKVAPPLIPVSMNDVDLNLYTDCLLEGEDWEREIEKI